MEVFFAVMVLGCTLLLTLLSRPSPDGEMSNMERLIDNSPPKDSPPSSKGLHPTSHAEAIRKQKLLQTVAQDPDSVTDTLRQWLRE